jgi:hypothetical protein
MNRPQVTINERHKADAGYYVLEIIPASDDVPAAVELHAVLSWGYEKNDQFSIPYPVTLSGVVADNGYILRPDGTVERVEGVEFASLDEFRLAVRDGQV